GGGDGGADARQRHSDPAHLLAAVVEARVPPLEREAAAQHVDHAGAEAPRLGGLDQAARGVERLLAGEDGERGTGSRAPDLLHLAPHLTPPAWRGSAARPRPAAPGARTACARPPPRSDRAPSPAHRGRRRRPPPGLPAPPPPRGASGSASTRPSPASSDPPASDPVSRCAPASARSRRRAPRRPRSPTRATPVRWPPGPLDRR